MKPLVKPTEFGCCHKCPHFHGKPLLTHTSPQETLQHWQKKDSYYFLHLQRMSVCSLTRGWPTFGHLCLAFHGEHRRRELQPMKQIQFDILPMVGFLVQYGSQYGGPREETCTNRTKGDKPALMLPWHISQTMFFIKVVEIWIKASLCISWSTNTQDKFWNQLHVNDIKACNKLGKINLWNFLHPSQASHVSKSFPSYNPALHSSFSAPLPPHRLPSYTAPEGTIHLVLHRIFEWTVLRLHHWPMSPAICLFLVQKEHQPLVFHFPGH